MSAYYNEYDKNAAAWLRELIKSGLIADGEVDERSIVDVRPDDLRGFDQCHFFAGIGVWSYALRRAGWSDDRPVWTASLPCQPFSTAGKQEGHADERHLAPVWLRLVRECRPSVCIGEQVAAAIGFGWLDALFIRLEQSDYAVGAAVFPAASVGAPHIRSRLFWVAESDGTIGRGEQRPEQSSRNPRRESNGNGGTNGDSGGVMGNADHAGSQGRRERGDGPGERVAGPAGMASFWSDALWLPCRDGKLRPTGPGIHPLVVGNAKRNGREVALQHVTSGDASVGERQADEFGGADDVGIVADSRSMGQRGRRASGSLPESGAVERSSGLRETDDRQGPTERIVKPLAHGTSYGMGHLCDYGSSQVESGEEEIDFNPNDTSEARVMRLRGYGNAIVAPAAQAFIEAYMECIE